MENMNQLQVKLHRAVFGPPHPVIVTEQRADPVEFVFQAVLRLEPEQRTRLIQRLKSRWGSPPKPLRLKSRVRSSPRGAFGWLTVLSRHREPALTNDEMRNKNADLQNRINEVLVKHPELRDVVDEVALKQGLWVQVGTPFLDRIQVNLLERARAIIERRPDLEHLFNI
jgi:hypothetical protein